jgi:phosphoglycolate phosphatase-like HAD superfamily hydrolase/membrane protease YdiL (CAAX protease family)
MWNTILFDLDGTLTDSGEGIEKCAQYALRHFGIDVPDLNQLRGFVGPPLKESFREYGLAEEQMDSAIEYFRERYRTAGVYENHLYPGIRELLEALKAHHFTLAVASSKLDSMVHEVLRYFDIEKYFTVIVGGTPDGSLVLKGDVIREALRRLGMEDMRDQVAYVGDRKHDIIGARQNGIASIGVLYGYGSYQELADENATAILASVQETGRYLFSQPVPCRHPYDLQPVSRYASISGHEGTAQKIWRCVYPPLFYFAVSSAVSMIGGIILTAVYMMSHSSAGYEDLYTLLTGQAVLLTGISAAVSIPFLVWFFVRDEKRRSAFAFRKGILQDRQWKIWKILAAVLFIAAAASCIDFLIGLSPLPEIDTAYQSAAEAITAPSLAMQIIVIGIVGPVAEELVFRALLFRRLRDYLNPVLAILISGIAFGVYHGNFVQGIFAGVLGILLALLYEESGTLIVPIAAHMANNLYATFLGQYPDAVTDPFSMTVFLIIVLVSVWFFFLRKRVKFH